MLRRPFLAWAVELGDLEAAEQMGVRTLELREQEKGRTYRVSLDVLRSKGFEFDRGCGRQIGLALGCFAVDGSPHGRRPGPQQLRLFSPRQQDEQRTG